MVFTEDLVVDSNHLVAGSGKDWHVGILPPLFAVLGISFFFQHLRLLSFDLL